MKTLSKAIASIAFTTCLATSAMALTLGGGGGGGAIGVGSGSGSGGGNNIYPCAPSGQVQDSQTPNAEGVMVTDSYSGTYTYTDMTGHTQTGTCIDAVGAEESATSHPVYDNGSAYSNSTDGTGNYTCSPSGLTYPDFTARFSAGTCTGSSGGVGGTGGPGIGGR